MTTAHRSLQSASGVYVFAETGDAWAAVQTANPAAHTTDAALSGEASAGDVATAVGSDPYGLTPLATIDWVRFDVMGSRGKEDPSSPRRRSRRGATRSAPSATGRVALDANNAWNQRARFGSTPGLLNTQTDQKALIEFIQAQPRKPSPGEICDHHRAAQLRPCRRVT